ncbi:helix-turn-helix domain-containing protein [Olsenella sp. Marseille-P4559]|uniref:winged helix-turn-helix transcriptional regulator n=1 Tax=Olsenella sp. Marseille-P4559 TaxID=2364795 RepID=UPI001F5F54E0|nr:helix-turn-helix domain-containing protein [Olsenella sp. Marseille-P4559]
MNGDQLASLECPVGTVMTVLGGKYKVLICFRLVGRMLRYSELACRVPRASPKMLSQQLKELEADDIMHLEMYPQVPPKVKYSLTRTRREACADNSGHVEVGRGALRQ